MAEITVTPENSERLIQKLDQAFRQQPSILSEIIITDSEYNRLFINEFPCAIEKFQSDADTEPYNINFWNLDESTSDWSFRSRLNDVLDPGLKVRMTYAENHTEQSDTKSEI